MSHSSNPLVHGSINLTEVHIPQKTFHFPFSKKNWELGIPCRKSFMETLWIFNIQENLHPSFKEINKLGVFFFMENITMNFSRDKGSTMESWKAIRDNNKSTCLVLDENVVILDD